MNCFCVERNIARSQRRSFGGKATGGSMVGNIAFVVDGGGTKGPSGIVFLSAEAHVSMNWRGKRTDGAHGLGFLLVVGVCAREGSGWYVYGKVHKEKMKTVYLNAEEMQRCKDLGRTLLMRVFWGCSRLM